MCRGDVTVIALDCRLIDSKDDSRADSIAALARNSRLGNSRRLMVNITEQTAELAITGQALRHDGCSIAYWINLSQGSSRKQRRVLKPSACALKTPAHIPFFLSANFHYNTAIMTSLNSKNIPTNHCVMRLLFEGKPCGVYYFMRQYRARILTREAYTPGHCMGAQSLQLCYFPADENVVIVELAAAATAGCIWSAKYRQEITFRTGLDLSGLPSSRRRVGPKPNEICPRPSLFSTRKPRRQLKL